MHFYSFNIGDFSLHTSHLTLEEEAVYRRLLDFYYDTELPIPIKTQPVLRRLRLGDYAEIVDSILLEFFLKQGDGWHNLRADIEISDYHHKGQIARENGKKGGRPKKNSGLETQRVILANQTITQSKAKQELVTNKQELITRKQELETVSDAEASLSIDKPINGDTKLIFEYWQEKMGKQGFRLTPKRREKIKTRLKTFSLNQLQLAIDGCRRSDYHQGLNDRQTEYNDLELIFRTDDKVEQFMAMAQKGQKQSQEIENWIGQSNG